MGGGIANINLGPVYGTSLSHQPTRGSTRPQAHYSRRVAGRRRPHQPARQMPRSTGSNGPARSLTMTGRPVRKHSRQDSWSFAVPPQSIAAAVRRMTPPARSARRAGAALQGTRWRDQPVPPVASVTHRTRRSDRYGKPSIPKPRVPAGWGRAASDAARTECCACRSMMPARPGPRPGRAGHPRRQGRLVAAPAGHGQ